jgi:hypothetical protein
MWYWPEKKQRSDQPWAAIVTYVHGDHMVNLSVWNNESHPIGKTSVPIVQDGSPHTASDSPYVEWMPFQVGQAKRHEAEAKSA